MFGLAVGKLLSSPMKLPSSDAYLAFREWDWYEFSLCGPGRSCWKILFPYRPYVGEKAPVRPLVSPGERIPEANPTGLTPGTICCLLPS